MKKWMIVVFYLFLFIWGITKKEQIILWVNETNTGFSYLCLMLLFSALIATVPIIPFTIFGGMIGVKYGIFLGLMINWFGMFLAATIYYIFARYFLFGYFQSKIQKYKKLHKVHVFIDNHVFLSIVLLRLIPVIPPFIIHIYSGLKPIPLNTYALATALGLIPPMFILAYGGTQLFKNLLQFFIILSLYVLTVLMTYLLYRIRIKSSVRVIKEQ